MNRWLTIRRMRGPAFLLLFGVTALLNQWGVLSFARSWPLYLILAGVFTLLERAAFREAEPPAGVSGYGQPYAPPPAPPAPATSTAISNSEPLSRDTDPSYPRREGEL